MAEQEHSTALALAEPRDFEVTLHDQYMPRLEELLAGTDITPERFIGMTTQALARDAKLMAPDVDRKSLLLAILTAAEMGLAPTGAFGGVWLVPYYDKELKKKRVQPITDWRGFIKMAYRSGQLRGAWARAVYSGEYFEVQQGTSPQIAHNYVLERDPDARVTHVYAVAHLTTGEKVFEVMTFAEIEAVRKRARAGEAGPWVTDWLEMARKTVVRRLFKYLPVAITPALAAALAAEDEWEEAVTQPLRPAALTDRRARLLAGMGAEVPEGGTETDSEAGEPASAANAIGENSASTEAVSGGADA